MIVLSNVTKNYSDRMALRGLSLHVRPGEMTFITGHSGAGKSTLLRVIALIERHTRGQVVVDGQDLDALGRGQTPYFRRKIGFVFQDHRLLPELSVFDNVLLPLVIAGGTRKEMRRRVRAALDQVGLLDKERLYPRTLSSGEQQRVGIARAVVHRPVLLLADEPTGNLDPELSFEIMALFQRFNQVGTTVVIATHEVRMVKRLGHRTIALEEGRMLQSANELERV